MLVYANRFTYMHGLSFMKLTQLPDIFVFDLKYSNHFLKRNKRIEILIHFDLKL